MYCIHTHTDTFISTHTTHKRSMQHAAFCSHSTNSVERESECRSDNEVRDRAREMEEKLCILRSTCSTIFPQPSFMHIQLRYKVQPASVSLQLASIMDGFVCVCVCVVGEWAEGGGGGGGGASVNESSIPQKCFHHSVLFPLHNPSLLLHLYYFFLLFPSFCSFFSHLHC